MDIEKLIEQLSARGLGNGTSLGYHSGLLDDAATALSTLQAENAQLRESRDHWKRLAHELSEGVNGKDAEHERLQTENEKLRAELEYEKEHAGAYYEECGQWEAENAQLKAKLEAFRREKSSIEQDFRAFTKQWWEQDSGFPCRWCKFENSGGCEWKAKQPNEEKICAGRAFEWRGQKEG